MTTGLGWAARIAMLLLLVLVPGWAIAGQSYSFDRLLTVLQTGDVVEVTEWTRTRTKGSFAELTPDSILVVTNGRPVRIAAGGVREIRLLRRREPGQERMADAGARCGGAPCMAVTLAFAGTTSLGRVVSRLFTRPAVVYRASRPE